ncbi:ribonuclease H-like domain-containing protein [Tanacetum coccineum]|uniref:Ribonuclease H-like domain-containing protein n=1 Tax=Tanacetum coccineum TaxID=301880 RepID=A0ABQ5GXW8_9ASTR
MHDIGAYTESKLRADGSLVSDPTLYRSLARALQYLIFTRPDLSYAVPQMLIGQAAQLLAVLQVIVFSLETLYCLGHLRGRRLCLILVSRGVANAVAETSWLHNLLRELHSPLHSATIVYCDNVYTIGKVRVLHVSSRYQYADIFTNGLPTALFDEFRTSLSIFVLPLQLREAISGLVLHVYHSLY